MTWVPNFVYISVFVNHKAISHRKNVISDGYVS